MPSHHQHIKEKIYLSHEPFDEDDSENHRKKKVLDQVRDFLNRPIVKPKKDRCKNGEASSQRYLIQQECNDSFYIKEA